MKQKIEEKMNQVILLMYFDQKEKSQQTEQNLSNYLKTLDNQETYLIFSKLKDESIMTWDFRVGAHGDITYTSKDPSLTIKGIEQAEYLLKLNWQRFFIKNKNTLLYLLGKIV